MMTDERIEHLTQAAERIYQYCEQGKGFFGGQQVSSYGRKFTAWNNFKYSKTILEEKLGRPLDGDEVTILSLATGGGPTPSLSSNMREEALETLWGRVARDNMHIPGAYKDMMKVLVSFY